MRSKTSSKTLELLRYATSKMATLDDMLTGGITQEEVQSAAISGITGAITRDDLRRAVGLDALREVAACSGYTDGCLCIGGVEIDIDAAQRFIDEAPIRDLHSVQNVVGGMAGRPKTRRKGKASKRRSRPRPKRS